MRLGYSTNAFVKFSLPQSLDRIAALGFKGVEIMCDRPHLYPPDFDDAQLTVIVQHLAEKGLFVTNLNSFTLFAVGDTHLPSWIEADAGQRQIRIDHTLACLRLAHRLGARNISIPPGGPLRNMSRSQALHHFYAGLEQVIPLAEELDIRLLVEPEPDLLIENSHQFLSFMREVRSKIVGINFDIGHFYCAGEEPAEVIEPLFEYTFHIHIEDIAPTRLHRHLICGLGAIDFKRFFKKLVALGYRHDLSLELYPYVDSPEDAGRRSLAHLQPIMEELEIDMI